MKVLDHLSGSPVRQARGKPNQEKAGRMQRPAKSISDKSSHMHRVTDRAKGRQQRRREG